MQVWLALNNLLVDPVCRAKALQQSSHGVETLLRIRRHMNDVLLDQLPVLADLQRVLDELAMGCAGLPHNSHTSLIIEQVLCLLCMTVCILCSPYDFLFLMQGLQLHSLLSAPDDLEDGRLLFQNLCYARTWILGK